MEGYVSLNSALENVGVGRFHYGLTVLVCCVILIQSWLMNQFMLFNVGLIIYQEGEIHNWSNSQRGIVGSCHMIGQMISTVIVGYLSDRKGRTAVYKGTIWVALLGVILVFFSNNIYAFSAFLMIEGMGAGSELSVSAIILQEYLPESKHSFLFMFNVFYCGGGALQALCSLFFMNFDTGIIAWRGCLIVIAVIIIVIGIIRQWLQETPHFLLAHERTEEAERVLQNVRRYNRGESLQIKLLEESLIEEMSKSQNEFRFLWKKKYLKVTVLATYIYTTYSLVSVFIDLFMPEILEENKLNLNEVYLFIFLEESIGSVAELVNRKLIDTPLGRKHTYFLASVLCGMMNISLITGLSKWVILPCCIFSNIFNSTGWGSLYILTQETYETKVRNSALGWATSCEGIGGILGPLVGGFLISLPNGNFLAVSVMVILYVSAGLSSLLFKETRPSKIV